MTPAERAAAFAALRDLGAAAVPELRRLATSLPITMALSIAAHISISCAIQTNIPQLKNELESLAKLQVIAMFQ